mgnify:CR=1 FL=1
MILRPERLTGVHPDLVKVVKRAEGMMPWDIMILEGVRTVERQRELVKQGASRTMNSRHIPGIDGLAKAFDCAPAPAGKPSWAWPLYHILAQHMKAAADEMRQVIEWGGDWPSFKDGPHWQLPYGTYK